MNYFELIHNELDRSSDDHSILQSNINIGNPAGSPRKQKVQGSFFVDCSKEVSCRSGRAQRSMSMNTSITSSTYEPLYKGGVKNSIFTGCSNVSISVKTVTTSSKYELFRKGRSKSSLCHSNHSQYEYCCNHSADKESDESDDWSTCVLFDFYKFHSRRKRFTSIPKEVVVDSQEDSQLVPTQQSGSSRRARRKRARSMSFISNDNATSKNGCSRSWKSLDI